GVLDVRVRDPRPHDPATAVRSDGATARRMARAHCPRHRADAAALSSLPSGIAMAAREYGRDAGIGRTRDCCTARGRTAERRTGRDAHRRYRDDRDRGSDARARDAGGAGPEGDHVRCHGFPARSFHLQAEQHCNQGDGVKTGLTLGALCVIALTGCELVTEPDDHPPGSRLPTEDFLAWDARRDGPMPELEIRGESGRIFIQGGLDTPVPCYRV